MPSSAVRIDPATYYVRDPFSNQSTYTEELAALAANLSGKGADFSAALLVHRKPDHVAVARDRRSGEGIALFGASSLVLPCGTELLLVDFLLVPQGAAGLSLAHKMLALTLLHMTGNNALPSALIANSDSRWLGECLRVFGHQLHGTKFHEQGQSEVVSFDAASLLSRAFNNHGRFSSRAALFLSGVAGSVKDIALHDAVSCRGLIVDLRGPGEGCTLEGLRRVYRRTRHAKQGQVRPKVGSLPHSS